MHVQQGLLQLGSANLDEVQHRTATIRSRMHHKLNALVFVNYCAIDRAWRKNVHSSAVQGAGRDVESPHGTRIMRFRG